MLYPQPSTKKSRANKVIWDRAPAGNVSQAVREGPNTTLVSRSFQSTAYNGGWIKWHRFLHYFGQRYQYKNPPTYFYLVLPIRYI